MNLRKRERERERERKRRKKIIDKFPAIKRGGCEGAPLARPPRGFVSFKRALSSWLLAKYISRLFSY